MYQQIHNTNMKKCQDHHPNRSTALKRGITSETWRLKTVSMPHGHESPAGEDADLYLEPTGLSIWAKCHVLMPFLEISLRLSVK